MAVLFFTLIAALTSSDLQFYLEHTVSILVLLCAERLWELMCAIVVAAALVWFANRTSQATADEKATVTKELVAEGALSEAFSWAAGMCFVGSAYYLLLSEDKFVIPKSHDVPYLERLAEVTPNQLLSMVLLAASFVTLVTCAGITIALDKAESMPRLSRLDAWCVVALFAQCGYVFWTTGLRLYEVFTMDASEQTYRQWQGLLFGLGGAGLGQVLVLTYHYLRREKGLLRFGEQRFIQDRNPPVRDANKSFVQEVVKHLAQPSAFALLGGYLIGTWKLDMMPESYYDESVSINWCHVILQLLVVDVFTVINHMAEHGLSHIYVPSHKPHHRFTSPTMFDAFDGSILDTSFLILLPLFSTMRILACVNAWSYIVFGFVYSVHFMMIHSEWANPLDGMAAKFGIYTAKDHHVHHARFIYNYAHFFTFWDRALGTYRPTV